MPKEIYPSSYRCDCGAQIDFFESTIKEVKAASMKRRQSLGEGGRGGHVVIFQTGRMVDILCPKGGKREIQSKSKSKFTSKQGQYLAFIHGYGALYGQAPAEHEMQRHFNVSPPTVHQMVLTLEKKGLIERIPGQARSIKLLVPENELPRIQ